MKAVLINHNFIPSWLLGSGLDYQIRDRSDSKDFLKDFPQERITYEENIGQVDFSKLSYLVDNYNKLPKVFLWGKTNLFKSISEEEYALVKDNRTFTSLLTQHHKTYSDAFGVVCEYKNGMYWERADDWYFNMFPHKYVKSFKEWCGMFGLPYTPYIPFAPGANYILTKETVHKHPKSLYQKMKSMLNYHREPVEAQCCERSYFLLWA